MTELMVVELLFFFAIACSSSSSSSTFNKCALLQQLVWSVVTVRVIHGQYIDEGRHNLFCTQHVEEEEEKFL